MCSKNTTTFINSPTTTTSSSSTTTSTYTPTQQHELLLLSVAATVTKAMATEGFIDIDIATASGSSSTVFDGVTLFTRT